MLHACASKVVLEFLLGQANNSSVTQLSLE
jgi:hypothetical protein